MGEPTLLVARTDAEAAQLITSDIDPQDLPFISGERTHEGFFILHGGLECAISRGLAYAPYADIIWCETAHPDLQEAKEFADAIHEKYPGKLLAYNCSPSFNWRANLSEKAINSFQQEIAKMGYRFQFVTLAGFHSLNAGMFELAVGYRDEGMGAYSKFQQREFELQRENGFRAVKHQSFVGAGYFDEIQLTISGGEASTVALRGSTEVEQFETTPA
jgi:isocitrate lyase